MSFGGEYLFPEKWKIINDTPDDGQLSKTEKIRRGEVQFHAKAYVDDDWKAHHGRMRQGTCMEAMEDVRLKPLGQQPLGADAPGFRARARKEYFDNRAAQAQNRVPQVVPYHTAPTSNGVRVTHQHESLPGHMSTQCNTVAPVWTVPPRAQVAFEQLATSGGPVAGRRASRDSSMGSAPGNGAFPGAAPGSAASGSSRGSRGSGVIGQGMPDMPAAGRRAMNRSAVIDGVTSGGWQGWNKPQAIDAYGMGRAEQKRNRWANDTPSYSLEPGSK